MSNNTEEKHICPACHDEIRLADERLCTVCDKPTHNSCGEMLPENFSFGDRLEKFVCRPDAIMKYVKSLNEDREKLVKTEELNKLKNDITREFKQQSVAINKIMQNIANIENLPGRLQANKEDQTAPSRPEKYSTENILHAGAYLIVFLFITAIIGYLIRLGWVQTPEVSIQYNLGEIIGALLVGVGAAAAGIAYALKELRPPREDQRQSGFTPETPPDGGTETAAAGEGAAAKE